MKRVQQLITRLEKETILFPFEGRVDLVKKRGDQIKPGDKLFVKKYKKILETHYLPKELGCRVTDCKDYIVRLNGEYVSNDEIVAERLTSGGLSLKRVIAQKDGILSFSRIADGYVDILSEMQDEEVVSSFYGVIEDIDMTKGMSITTSAYVVKGVNNFSDDLLSMSGRFSLISDGDSVYSDRDLADSYEGEIVFAGRYLSYNLLQEIVVRGAKHIVVYSMDYSDFINSSTPVTVLGGFGNIPFPKEWHDILKNLDGSYIGVEIGKERTRFVIPDIGQNFGRVDTNYEKKIVPVVKSGMYVRVKGVDSLNIVGKIFEVNSSDGFVVVNASDGSKLLLSIDLVDILSL